MTDPYTIIIPTMWVNIPVLNQMLQKYEGNPLISEVLIINNNGSKQPALNFKKVRVIGTGDNIYVNPAWNLGVNQAKTEKIIIANDDILIKPFDKLLNLIDKTLEPNMLIGVDTHCYPQKGFHAGSMRIEKQTGERNWGFGTLMAICKSSYVQIPARYKIWYGDDVLYKANHPMVIKGVQIITRMSETVRNPIFKEIKQQDIKQYETDNHGPVAIPSALKVLVLWSGLHKRDLAQKDMYDLLGQHCKVSFADSSNFFGVLRIFKPDVVWLDIYHQHIRINWDYVFRRVRVPVIIDQADNEDFAKMAMRYRFARRAVITSRYLPNEAIGSYAQKYNIRAMQLSWYVNPDRFSAGEKTIDVGFVCYPKGRRKQLAQELKEVCDKNGWSLVTGHMYGSQYTEAITRCKVFVVECDRKCLTQKYIEGSLAKCTLAGDVPAYPPNDFTVYSFDYGIEEMLRLALKYPVLNNVESDFLSNFAHIIKYLGVKK